MHARRVSTLCKEGGHKFIMSKQLFDIITQKYSNIAFAKADHLDPVSSTDGHFLTKDGFPHLVLNNTTDEYCPAEFELFPITPNDFTLDDYKPADVPKRTLNDVITTLGMHKMPFMSAETCDALWQLCVIETLNVWLCARGQWMEYSPRETAQFRFSWPRYVFHFTSGDAWLPPDINDSAGEPDIDSAAFLRCCSYVFATVTGSSPPKDWLKKLSTGHFRAFLHSARFKEISTDEKASEVAFHVFGGGSNMRVKRGDYWTHLTFEPGVSVLPEASNALLSVVLWMASKVLNYTVMGDLSKSKESTWIAEMGLSSTGSSSSSKKKRKKGSGEHNATIAVLKRFFDTLPPRIHSSRLAYTCYIRESKLHGYPSPRQCLDSQTSPLGLDRLYWKWLVARNGPATYVDPYTGRLGPNNNKLALGSPQGRCDTRIEWNYSRVWYVDARALYKGSFNAHQYRLLIGVLLLPLFAHDEHFGHECPNVNVCIQHSLLAFSVLCDTYTEVWDCMRNLWPDLGFEQLQQSYRGLMNEMMARPEVRPWLEKPSTESVPVVRKACYDFLVQDHTPLDEDVLDARDKVCEELGYSDKLIRNYSGSKKELVEIKDDQPFDSLHDYLQFCDDRLRIKVLYPLVRCWEYKHPRVVIEASSSSSSGSTGRSGTADSMCLSLQQIVIGNVTNDWFMNQLKGIRDVQDEDSKNVLYGIWSMLQPAKGRNKGVDEVLGHISRVLGPDLHRGGRFDDVKRKYQAILSDMIVYQRNIDERVLLDVASKLANVKDRPNNNNNDPFPVIMDLIQSIWQTHQEETREALGNFKRARLESNVPNYLLKRIVDHIKD